MARSSLVDTTTEQLVERVATGVFPVGEPLPAQDALAVDLGVSRLTVREAIKALADRGLLRVEHGSGTFVNPPHRWTDIEALSRRADASNDLDVRKALIEVRRMIEVGAADLCARRHGPEVVGALTERIEAMDAAHAAGDVDAFVTHDIAFHDVILRGSGNPFIAAIFAPLRDELARARRQTSAIAAIRVNAQAHHRRICEAIRTGDAAAARGAMNDHMDQTSADLVTHLG